MSATGTKKGILEVFKFACYVGIPISMMSIFANNPDNLEKIIRNVSILLITLCKKYLEVFVLPCMSSKNRSEHQGFGILTNRILLDCSVRM